VAFGKAVEMLSGQSAGVPPARTLPLLKTTKVPAVGEDEPRVAKIARKLAVPAETIAEVYSEDAEEGVETGKSGVIKISIQRLRMHLLKCVGCDTK
jgi:hypothetical protein